MLPDNNASSDVQLSSEHKSASRRSHLLLSGLLLTLIAAVSAYFLAGGLLSVGTGKSSGLTFSPFVGQRVVVFDPVRFMNAQRAAASILAMRPSADLALTMTQVAKQAEAVIRDKADGALVLIKQSVVLTDGIRDITDEVLLHFGLPTAVPTLSTSVEVAVEELAPTTRMFSVGKQAEDAYLERERTALIEEAKQDARSAHEKVLP